MTLLISPGSQQLGWLSYSAHSEPVDTGAPDKRPDTADSVETGLESATTSCTDGDVGPASFPEKANDLSEVWDVRNPNPKISWSYELYRRRYSTSKISNMGLWNFRYPHLAADSWVCAINRHLR